MKVFKLKNLIGYSVLPWLLLGCTSEDSGGTTTEVVPKLEASPYLYRIDPVDNMDDESLGSRIDIQNVVALNGAEDWQLAAMPTDDTGFGEVTEYGERSFFYKTMNSGSSMIKFTITGGGVESSSSVLIAVNERATDNTPPSAEDFTRSIPNDEELVIDLRDYVFDLDGDSFVIEDFAPSHSSRFTFDKEFTVTYKPDGFIGTENVAYSVRDSRGGYDLGYIVITTYNSASGSISPNSPPIARPAFFDVDKKLETVKIIELEGELGLIEDPDDDPLSLKRIYANNNRATIGEDGKTIIYTPGSFVGVEQITYVVSDGQLDSAATLTFAVSDSVPSNNTPKAEKVFGRVVANQTESILIDVSKHVSDIDQDKLRLTEVVGSKGRAVISSGSSLMIEYSPELARDVDEFLYVITDDKGGYAQNLVTITIDPIGLEENKNAPVAELIKAELDSNQVLKMNINDYFSDVETPHSQLDVKLMTQPMGTATASIEYDGAEQTYYLVYEPNGYVGADNIKYSVTDEGVVIDEAGTVEDRFTAENFIVIRVNEPDAYELQLEPISISVTAEEETQIHWQEAIDPESNVALETLRLESTKGATKGKAEIVGSDLFYTSTQGNVGQDVLVYTIRDEYYREVQGTVIINIETPAPPVIKDIQVALETIDPIKNEKAIRVDVSLEKEEGFSKQYHWSVNGISKGSGQKYAYSAADKPYVIRVDVEVSDRYGQMVTDYKLLSVQYKVDSIVANDTGFTAIRNDGSLVTWGPTVDSAQPSIADYKDVKQVVGSSQAFAAVTSAGDVYSWGGGIESPEGLTDIKELYANKHAFAALSNEGLVFTWGSPNLGGNSNTVGNQLQEVRKVFATDSAFAALTEGGAVITWGSNQAGGSSSAVAQELRSGIVDVVANKTAFVAIKEEGDKRRLIAWEAQGGLAETGNNGGTVPAEIKALTNVQTVYATDSAFVAQTADGAVYAWGNTDAGAEISEEVQALIKESRVSRVFSNQSAFAAILENRRLVVWGNELAGGNFDDVKDINDHIVSITATDAAFAALTNQKTVITWGSESHGGDSSDIGAPDADDGMNKNIREVIATSSAFAAVNETGKVLLWGDKANGAEYNRMNNADKLDSNVHHVYATQGAFALITGNDFVVSWGNENFGADTGAAQAALARTQDEQVIELPRYKY